MSKYLAKFKALREKSASPGNCQNCQNPHKAGFDSFDSGYGSRFLRPEKSPTGAGENSTTGCTQGSQRLPETLDVEAHRFEDRAAILESTAQAEYDANPYASALAALRAKCPAYIDATDWQRAIEDGGRFVTRWGEQAEALGWASADLFGLHTPPEKPAPNYRRLSRHDQTGLIWLLRGRPVIVLTSTEAIIRCPVARP